MFTKTLNAIRTWMRTYRELGRAAAEATAQGRVFSAQAEEAKSQAQAIHETIGRANSATAPKLYGQVSELHGNASDLFRRAYTKHAEASDRYTARAVMTRRLALAVGALVLVLAVAAQIVRAAV
jgi:hypothetical protein